MVDIADIERIYLGGPIVTVNDTDEVVEALAISGEIIVAVGRESEIRALAGDETEIIDLGKRHSLAQSERGSAHADDPSIFRARGNAQQHLVGVCIHHPSSLSR